MMGRQHERIRVAAHSSAHGTWRVDSLTPTARMAPFVRQVYAYAESGTPFSRRRELPIGDAVLIFNLGPELRIEHPRPTRSRFAAGSGFYSGPSPNYAVSETDGAQEGVQVMLTLLGARALLGRPLGAIGDGLTPPGEVLGNAAGEIAGRLGEARSPAERLVMMEAALERRFAQGIPVRRELVWAWRRIEAGGGRVRIGALAAELGCSRKHLAVGFRHEFGITPKLLGRILRFRAALGRIQSGAFTGWAALAAECGYADQAHLAREFRAFAGSAPTEFLRHRLPDDGGFVD
ncbi:MAG TPA: AraC family transcriptional regulator [Acetobacteraceae bacterium]|nr:AraC family transcriptional regulator [Acetobacteraceae bacterium]